MRKWAPFGGPPEDECFIEFGTAAARAHERRMQIICTTAAGYYYSEADHRLLVTVAEILAKASPTYTTLL